MPTPIAIDPDGPMAVSGPPHAAPVRLQHRPQVLSWDSKDATSQKRLAPYMDEITQRFAAGAARGPVAFDLSCGLGPTWDLEAAGDLDNFLFPVGAALGWPFVAAAWGSKHPGVQSTLAVGPPTPLEARSLTGWEAAHVRTTKSASSTAWKQEIAGQLNRAGSLPAAAAAELIVQFRIGQGRAWHNLWKPAIDTLGNVLGRGPKPWSPRDGRIIRLGLSVAIDQSLGWDVVIDFWWRPTTWPLARSTDG